MTAAGEIKGIRVAVAGCGEFGRNHARVYCEMESAELVGVFDTDPARAAAFAREFNTQAFSTLQEMRGRVDAASVAVPTIAHAEVGCALMELGIDVLVEKPMAKDLADADALLAAAKKYARILQVGHVERFNPAVLAVEPIINRPLFFEVHRLGVFTGHFTGAGRRTRHRSKSRGHSGAQRQSRYRACAAGIRRRRCRQCDRQPRVHRTRSQSAFFSTTRIHFTGLCAPRRFARWRQAAWPRARVCV